MSVREQTARPECFPHFNLARYRWLELHDNGEVYGHAAIAELDDALELHLTLHQWGAATYRKVRGDLDWLKGEARRLGKAKITGIRAHAGEEFDPRLFKFARMLGFTEMQVYQTASIEVPPTS